MDQKQSTKFQKAMADLCQKFGVIAFVGLYIDNADNYGLTSNHDTNDMEMKQFVTIIRDKFDKWAKEFNPDHQGGYIEKIYKERPNEEN